MICNLRIIGFCASALTLAALIMPATAAPDMMANIYANTLVYTFPDKNVSKVLAAKDGTWTSTSTDPKNPTNSGNWAVLNGWLCSTSNLTPKTRPWCRKAAAHEIGDKWTEAWPDKTVTQVTLAAGR
jgi:hypothetical protein